MDFHDLGCQCDVMECRQHDFLPFKCDACDGSFCIEHRTYKAHECEKGMAKQHGAHVLDCPLCAKQQQEQQQQPRQAQQQQRPPSSSKPNVKQGDPLHKDTKYHCAMPKCQKSELVPVTCRACGRNFCMRHRLEASHKCPRSPLGGGTAATANNPPGCGGDGESTCLIL
eukprot:TRINITY_DN192_c0_g2_i1.p1 TRINITY_DN192_c0_g2~~TRINITY_DN192_c0_g2_i1.p1  ORF type:complete len:187 (-),score=29.01 TRINITY_DN192_c0_g2_i1:99-605(-)